jgi:hypothetical protein
MDKMHSLQKSSQYNNSRKKTIEGFGDFFSRTSWVYVVLFGLVVIGGIVSFIIKIYNDRSAK